MSRTRRHDHSGHRHGRRRIGFHNTAQAAQDWYDQFYTPSQEEADFMPHDNHTASFWSSDCSDRAEKMREKRAKRLIALGRTTTPWAFIRSLHTEAVEFLIAATSEDRPSWITEEHIEENLELAFHREITTPE